jgi:hypothetical protein
MDKIIALMNTTLANSDQKAKNMDAVAESVFQYFVDRAVAGSKGVPVVFQQWVVSLFSNAEFLLHRGSSYLIIELTYGTYISKLTAQQKKELSQAIDTCLLPIESTLKHYLFELKDALNKALSS